MKTTTDIPIAINPRRSIGGIYPQIVIEENHADSLHITDYPVEDGSSISDHAYKKPVSVSITAGTSATEEDIKTVYAKLLELQSKREPFDVITGKRMYKSMLIEELTVSTDKATENVLRFTAVCKQIRIVGLKTTSLPPIEKQAMPDSTADTVDVGQKTPEETANQSVLDSIYEIWGKK